MMFKRRREATMTAPEDISGTEAIRQRVNARLRKVRFAANGIGSTIAIACARSVRQG